MEYAVALSDHPRAAVWLDYTMKAALTVFPHWAGHDGGWAEGINYGHLAPEKPADLPNDRAFHGVGWATLHSRILEPEKDLMVMFKSSPYRLPGRPAGSWPPQNPNLHWAWLQRNAAASGTANAGRRGTGDRIQGADGARFVETDRHPARAGSETALRLHGFSSTSASLPFSAYVAFRSGL
jgi:hypothetical protein